MSDTRTVRKSQKIDRAADGFFYVRANVNGTPIRLLVDTGASHIVLTADDAKRLKLDGRSDAGPSLTTAAGQVRTTWTTLRSVDVAGRRQTDVRAAVAPASLQVSLLGQNMLSNLSLTIQSDEMTLH